MKAKVPDEQMALSTGDPRKTPPRGPQDEVPPDFPNALRPHARRVWKVLMDVAEFKGAKRPTARALGHVVMARPYRPLVRSAHDFAAHWEGTNRPMRDVVAAYRNWLDRTDDLAATEPIWWEAGYRPDTLPAGVTPIRRNQNTVPVGAFREAARRMTEQDGIQ